MPRLRDHAPSGAAGGDLTGSYPNPSIASGVIGTANFSGTIPAVRARSGDTVPVASGRSGTPLPWSDETYDTADLHSTVTDTSRLTAPVTGVYNIIARVRWDSNPDGQRLLTLRTGPPVPPFSLCPTGSWERQTLAGITRSWRS